MELYIEINEKEDKNNFKKIKKMHLFYFGVTKISIILFLPALFCLGMNKKIYSF